MAYATDFNLRRVLPGAASLTLEHVEVAVSAFRMTAERPERYPDVWHHMESGHISQIVGAMAMQWLGHARAVHPLPDSYQVFPTRRDAARAHPELEEQRQALARTLLRGLLDADDPGRLRVALWSCFPTFKMLTNLALANGGRTMSRRMPIVMADAIADAFLMNLLEASSGLAIDPWVDQTCRARWGVWTAGYGLYGVVDGEPLLYRQS